MTELEYTLQIVGWAFFGSILGAIALYWLVTAIARWVDRNSPLNRDDRRQLRSVSSGKKAMAGER